MFSDFQRDLVKITIAVIGAVTVGNALANPSGTAALAKAITDFPVRIAQAVRR